MYSGVLNHNTDLFCSFFREESPIKCRAEDLYDYFKEYLNKHKNSTHVYKLFINPPFDEKSLGYA